MNIQSSVNVGSQLAQSPPVFSPVGGSSAGVVAPVGTPVAPPPTNQQAQQAAQALNQSASFLNRDLTFSVDQATHSTVVQVVEAQTGQVITQIPSKQALAIAQAINALPQGSTSSGILLSRKA